MSRSRWLLLAFLLIGASTAVRAEPAFAARTGHRCSTCHVNRTGGGLRTPFGVIYTQTVLPARTLRWREENNLLPANPDARFHVGANFRAQYRALAPAVGAGSGSLEIPEANVYVQARLLPGKLSLYLDETLGPGGAAAREFFGLFEFKTGNGYVKAGKFLPPFGWRLPDDEAFIRRATGFSYSAPDTGVEVGFEPGMWSFHLAAVNGSGGGSDADHSKKLSLVTVRRFGPARIGVSASHDRPQGDRIRQAGLLASWKAGRIAVLAEADHRELRRATGEETEQRVAFAEINVLMSRGFNLKIAHDWIDPDRGIDTDEQTRTSVGVEYTPYPFFQLRSFVRWRDGPPQTIGARDDSAEIEAHFFF